MFSNIGREFWVNRSILPEELFIKPGESYYLQVPFKVPESALMGHTNYFTIKASDAVNPNVYDGQYIPLEVVSYQ